MAHLFSSIHTLSYVITSRIRLARNVRGHRFPPTASSRERQAVFERVQHAVSQSRFFRHSTTITLDRISSFERKVLEEKRLISHLSSIHGSSRAAILPQKPHKQTVLLINEEDHLRIQAFSEGLALQKAWKSAHTLERHLQQRLEFAESPDDGYLTTCQSNAGSGIRASVMLFAPGLILQKRMPALIRRCVDAGYTVRGSYGEGSESLGYLLQISYQHPRERHVASILRSMEGLCKHLIGQERYARLTLTNSSSRSLQRRIHNAQKFLTGADTMSLKRGMEIIAMFRLAVDLGIHSQPYGTRQSQYRQLKQLDRVTIRIQPAHVRAYGIQHHQLVHASPEHIDDHTENRLRATFLHQQLGHLCLPDLQNAREKLL